MHVPLCDLTQQYESLQGEIDYAMRYVAASGHYILGPNVSALEHELADYCRTRYAVAVGNGTDALYLALRGLQIGPGDEVITTPFSFVATSEAISLTGARPVFVDVRRDTLNIDPDCIEAALTERTKAILPVHLFGHPCEMPRICALAARHGVAVVEDCAQALGATIEGRPVGSWGDAGCLSFFPSKPLGALGDGGMVVTSRPDLFERIEMLRRHGGKLKYHHTETGINSRLDEIQAAILRVKLPYLDRWNLCRAELAAGYNQRLSGVPGMSCPRLDDPVRQSVFHQYTMQTRWRDAIATQLKQHGVQTGVYYPVPLHLQPVHHDLGYDVGDLPNSEIAAQQVLSLPMFPELTQPQQQYVVEQLTRAATGLADRPCRAA